MATSSAITWVPGLLLLSTTYLWPTSTPRWGIWVIATYLFVYSLAVFWLHLVTKNVPEPYLDEIFHIPQAQLYCLGRYDYWDPKLTTPPGLYIFATLFTKLRLGTWDVLGLRLFNSVILPITMLYALSCRHVITLPPSRLRNLPSISPDSIHTALNIALFPPIFFFSGLFYTDLLSTCAVLATYRLFLRRKGAGLWTIYPTGLLALAMRQTNIFWVAIFMGGLEAVRSIKSDRVAGVDERLVPGPWKERVIFEPERWGRGEIHDVPLKDAGVHDFILCTISIAIAILHQPVRIMVRLWPYIALLVSFGAFVLWNGGVVLGDKSNHVATIHLSQLLYLLAFTAFFSLPLIIPPTLVFLHSLLSLIRLPLFPRLVWQYCLISTYCVGALGVTLLVIRYNTIIHPFTLADNRHYVFYVFRYTILRHPAIRYLLAPIYLACGWAIYLTLCSLSTSSPISSTVRLSPRNTQKKSYQNDSGKEQKVVGTERERRADQEPTTSFLLILLLTTALSLVTAPLVEPRYFIIPWVMWRLHVPTINPRPATTTPDISSSKSKRTQGLSGELLESVKILGYKGHDYRLWSETLYFLAINAITGYVFLYRGFSWPQEPGKVQRFMW